MQDESKVSLSQLVNNWARTFFKLLSDMAQLVSLEAQLAKRSLVTIVILLIVLACLLMTTWMSLLALIVAFFLYLHFTLVTSVLIIVLLNIFLIIGVYAFILKLKEDLFFPVTRRQLRLSNFIKKKEPNDGELKTKN